MSYSKHTWASGNIITAQKMNEMETGIYNPNRMIETGSSSWYLRDQYGATVYITDIINAIATCFRGDTTYVTMYDGTKKLIKDVKVGDSVLGFNPNTKEYCEAIVLANTKTKDRKTYKTYVLSDGRTLDIYGDEIMVFRGSRSANTIPARDSMLNLYEKWHLQKADDCRRFYTDETLDYDNSPFVVHRFTSVLKETVPSYFLHTSCGTYFVNGVCGGQITESIELFFTTRHIYIPDNIKAVFAEIATRHSQRDEELPDTTIEHPEYVNEITAYSQACAIITKKKQYLADTDYKAMKYAEGAITEEEWLPIKEARAAARAAINEQEAIRDEYKSRIAEHNPNSREELEDWKARARRWHGDVQILVDHLEDFRAWAQDLKAAIVVPEENVEVKEEQEEE